MCDPRLATLGPAQREFHGNRRDLGIPGCLRHDVCGVNDLVARLMKVQIAAVFFVDVLLQASAPVSAWLETLAGIGSPAIGQMLNLRPVADCRTQ